MRAKEAIKNALAEILAQQELPWPEKLVIEAPKDPKFGDLSTNAAMLLAKNAGQKPRDLASLIAQKLPTIATDIEKVEIAGPGFINVTFKPAHWRAVIADVERQGADFGKSRNGQGQKAMVEYVSANPTGPLHVGHGRGAALGDSVARILKAAGYDVATEYYLNDAGRQMRTLGLSIWLRAQELLGKAVDFPADCYQGEYIKDLARALLQNGELENLPEQDGIARCQAYGQDVILQGIKDDLAQFGCSHEKYFSEASLVKGGAVQKALDKLRADGHSYEEDGALWLDTTAHGDDRNRVLRKSDGYLTYFATDIAYHEDKFERGFDWLIDVWGADHHGYIPRMKAAIAEMGHNPDALSVLLVQLVNLLRNGEVVAMSTRAGEFVTLAEVVREVGTDAARFMFLSRSSDTPLDFDLELAKQRSMDNPVYYVQYAHARIAALMRRAAGRGIELGRLTDQGIFENLASAEEMAILRQLAAFEDVVANAAKNLAPHQIAKYVQELAGIIHSYYAKCRILAEDDPQGSVARLALLRAAGQTISNGLWLLGVSAPDSM